MRCCMRSYQIKFSGGHIEVFDVRGRFLFSADTESEAINELREMESTGNFPEAY